MTARLELRILGCGSSGGVPRLGGHWGNCDPKNPKNRRTRCSLLVTQYSAAGGATRVLIDTSPDMRAQLLDADIGAVDAVVFTHSHADHMHGIDDLRMIVFNTNNRLPVWADAPTRGDLLARFGYVFQQPEGSSYPPICDLNLIDGEITIDGEGGSLKLVPFEVQHGKITALGFRIHDIAYLPDVSDIPDAVWPVLDGLDLWIVDALRRAPHPTHAHLEKTLEWIDQVGPKRAVLTNMHNDLDHDAVAAETPPHVDTACHGMTLRVPIA